MSKFFYETGIYVKFVLVSGLVFLCACTKSEPEPEPETAPERTVLVYMAVNNNLSSAGREDFEDIKSGYIPKKNDSGVLLVYLHESIHNPALVRLWKQNETVVVDTLVQYPAQNSCMDTTMNKVLKDAFGRFSAPEQDIIFSSHSSGWLPVKFYRENPKSICLPKADIPYSHLVKSFGFDDNGSEMDISVLRKCLEKYHFGFIGFDCCLMGGAEVAYEMKDVCDYLMSSPTEILSDGFPYKTLMEVAFDGNRSLESRICDIARMYYKQYESRTGFDQSATISVSKTSSLDELASAVKRILDGGGKTNTDTLSVSNSELKYVQRYFTYHKHWFYDLDHYIVNVCPSDSLYDIFISTLGKTVVYCAATPKCFEGWDTGFEIKHFSGLSIYVDRPENDSLERFYRTLAWGKAIGF